MRFWFILQLRDGAAASEIYWADELKWHVVAVLSLIPEQQHKELDLGIIMTTQLSASRLILSLS